MKREHVIGLVTVACIAFMAGFYTGEVLTKVRPHRCEIHVYRDHIEHNGTKIKR